MEPKIILPLNHHCKKHMVKKKDGKPSTSDNSKDTTNHVFTKNAMITIEEEKSLSKEQEKNKEPKQTVQTTNKKSVDAKTKGKSTNLRAVRLKKKSLH